MSDNDPPAPIEPLPTAGADVASNAIAVPAPDEAGAGIPNIMPTADHYHGHFLATYIVLGVVLAAAIAGAIVIATGSTSSGPSAVSGDSWSTWQPQAGSAESMIDSVSDHVSSGYQGNANGGALDSVGHQFPVTFPLPTGTQAQVGSITLRQVPDIFTKDDTKLTVTPANTVLFNLVGTVANKSGTLAALPPPRTLFRQRLLRREGLELGLYTLKFVPGIDNVVVFTPGNQVRTPSNGAAQAALVLTKENMKAALDLPIYQTLTATKTDKQGREVAPLPTDPDTAEQASIDSLTSRASYYWGSGADSASLIAPTAANPFGTWSLVFDPWSGIARA